MSGDAAGPRSTQLYEQAQRWMPGGVNSPVRAFGAVGGTPVFFRRGEGACLYDEDGREYIDYVLSWGPLILGHRPGPVLAALHEALDDSLSLGAPTRWEVEFAQQVCEALPGVDRLRLVSSGTEAAMSALRLARAATGRSKIVKFAGGYHGHADSLLVAAGSGVVTLGLPGSPGVTEGTAADTLTVPYNDAAAVAEVFERFGTDIAAVVVEPVAGNMGCVPPVDGFLSRLRELTRDHGALLIFDEVITGFRVGYSGAQGRFGVVPDLTCLGKIIGGGLPLAAYGGRADLMSLVAPEGPVYQAGTLSGNPLAVRAGLATLKALADRDPYAELDQVAGQLVTGLSQRLEAHGIEHCVQRAGSMLTLFFRKGPVRSLSDAQESDTAAYSRFFHGLLRRGVYIPPSQFECWFISTAHGQAEIERTLEAVDQTLREW